MKRALAMALGAMMVAGSAAPASAASQIDFSGYYRVYYMNDMNLGKKPDSNWYTDGKKMTDSYWAHRLNIDLVFRATDEISVYWRLRAPTFKRFGQSGYSDNDGQGRTGMVTHHIYGQIDQDWGTVRVGQIDDGFDSYGLGSLGYAPSTDPMWTFSSPFDSGGRIEGVRYNNKWDNGFGLMAQYQKVDNNDAQNLNGTHDLSSNRSSDQDFDRFMVEGTYEWDGGGAALGVRYDRNATTDDGWYIQDVNGNFHAIGAHNAWYVNPAVMHSWGDFSFHFEGMAGWGTIENRGLDRRGRAADVDTEGYAFYLDFDYNYGPGNVTLAGWWASGSDYDEGEIKGLVGLDQGNFYPLLVAYNADASGWGRESNNAVALANNASEFVDQGWARGNFLNDAAGTYSAQLAAFKGAAIGNRSSSLNNFDGMNNGTSNHWAIALTGNHAFTDDIAVHYGVAYLALNEPNYKVATRGNTNDLANTMRYTDQDEELGFEADLAFSFQLLDNLQFVTSFGYMFNGDAYKSLRGYRYNETTGDVRAVWDDPKDSYVWYNTLTFSF